MAAACEVPFTITQFDFSSTKTGDMPTSSAFGTTISVRANPFRADSGIETSAFTAYFPGGSESVA